MSGAYFDIPHDVLVDANRLKNSNIQKKQIRETVIEILRGINDELRSAHNEGKHCIIVDMPIMFEIPNMMNKDAQRAVWATTIDILRDKKYRVWINYSDVSCRLKITWISHDDELTIKMQKQTIADCRGTH
jgi:hypothetical protein